jgi:hypothetical protein
LRVKDLKILQKHYFPQAPHITFSLGYLDCWKILKAMSLPKTFPLKAADGKTIQIPSIGYGTWASGESVTMLL